MPHKGLVLDIKDYSFEGLKLYLTDNDMEGIVFWDVDSNRKCKIRKKDFGIERNINESNK